VLVVDLPGSAGDRSSELRSTHWLVRDRAIAVLPTVASLRTLRDYVPAARRAAAVTVDKRLLAFADPDFAGTGRIPGRVPGIDSLTGAPIEQANAAPMAGSIGRGVDAEAPVSSLDALPPLYHTLEEARSIASLLDADPRTSLYVGPSASKAAVLALQTSGTLGRAQVVSFSTHAFLRDEFAGLTEPALALSKPATANAADDGLLRASEAAALSINADWVILSACNTAGGDAGGLSGLAKGFFAAGATSLLVSHWRVDDSATAWLVRETLRLYEGGAASFSAGTPDAGLNGVQPRGRRARAVQLAALEMLDDASHDHADPRYWAPFVVVGEPR
jgi:CHAT domain-containing protein